MKRISTILKQLPEVQNFESPRTGKPVANQFEIYFKDGVLFKSYSSNIALKANNTVYLDKNKWDFSVTTGKYRNEFLRENIQETREKIKQGIYKLVNLN